MKRYIHGAWVLLAGGMMLVSGCATTPANCDPTQGDVSLISKFNCKYSGAYDARVEEKQQALLKEQALNRQFREALASIELEQAQSNAKLRKKTTISEGLSMTLSTLMGQLKQKAATRTDLQQKVARLEASVQSLTTQPRTAAAKKKELNRLQAQLGSLQQDLGLQ